MEVQPDNGLESLLSKLLDGQLTEAEANQLTDCLRCDPQARVAYHGQIQLHAMLHWKEGNTLEPEAAGRVCGVERFS